MNYERNNKLWTFTRKPVATVIIFFTSSLHSQLHRTNLDDHCLEGKRYIRSKCLPSSFLRIEELTLLI